MKLASIDIGTNTLRLLIAEIDKAGQIHDTILRREITRLGGGFDGKNLHPEAKRRTLAALGRFARILAEQGVSKVRAAATSVVRDAEDGPRFIEEIKVKTGLEVELISGEKEAAMALDGVFSELDGRDRTALIFDIGGGSTEYMVAQKERVCGLMSLNMGVVAITEGHLKSDPPSQSDLNNISSLVDNFLIDLEKGLPELELIEKNREAVLVGTAGTITSLAALDQNLKVYDSRKINNYVLTKKAIEKLFQQLVLMTHSERAAIEALEEGRADLIITGTLIVIKTMDKFGFRQMVVSDYGLLEGLLIDLARKEGVLQ